MYLPVRSAGEQTPRVPTFARGTVSGLPARHVKFQERLEHARSLTALVLENPDLDLEAERRKRRYAPSAVDDVALRGIPAVGRFGVGGAIAGTKPGANLFR
jgi:hypothetical protein